ncbi:BQ2448_7028 [Microbotryum intermedium]|uniref:BQ2448_7028 protein n=1 Tax=Microbotryum intermedium TaxID=269621 RepID=A0A238FM61_9BASI|nr:BQ2448_7028 [Microbotryum intermedium]
MRIVLLGTNHATATRPSAPLPSISVYRALLTLHPLLLDLLTFRSSAIDLAATTVATTMHHPSLQCDDSPYRFPPPSPPVHRSLHQVATCSTPTGAGARSTTTTTTTSRSAPQARTAAAQAPPSPFPAFNSERPRERGPFGSSEVIQKRSNGSSAPRDQTIDASRIRYADAQAHDAISEFGLFQRHAASTKTDWSSPVAAILGGNGADRATRSLPVHSRQSLLTDHSTPSSDRFSTWPNSSSSFSTPLSSILDDSLGSDTSFLDTSPSCRNPTPPSLFPTFSEFLPSRATSSRLSQSSNENQPQTPAAAVARFNTPSSSSSSLGHHKGLLTSADLSFQNKHIKQDKRGLILRYDLERSSSGFVNSSPIRFQSFLRLPGVPIWWSLAAQLSSESWNPPLKTPRDAFDDVMSAPAYTTPIQSQTSARRDASSSDSNGGGSQSGCLRSTVPIASMLGTSVPWDDSNSNLPYPLTPFDTERIARLHGGRIPRLGQLAPAESTSANQAPIINTGNVGPMQRQQGDWTCECGFVNWRRRKICLRCFPFAHDLANSITIHRSHSLNNGSNTSTEINSTPVYAPTHPPSRSLPMLSTIAAQDVLQPSPAYTPIPSSGSAHAMLPSLTSYNSSPFNRISPPPPPPMPFPAAPSVFSSSAPSPMRRQVLAPLTPLVPLVPQTSFAAPVSDAMLNAKWSEGFYMGLAARSRSSSDVSQRPHDQQQAFPGASSFYSSSSSSSSPERHQSQMPSLFARGSQSS